MDFTDEIVLSLISEFEKHQILWDNTHIFYKLNNKVKNAQNIISAVFRVDTEIFKKNFCYNLLQFKLLTEISGMGTNEIYGSMRFAYNAYCFCREYMSNTDVR